MHGPALELHLLDEVGRVGILVNAVGGNLAGATLGEGVPVLDIPEDAFREVVNLNLVGTLPFQVFGAAMTSGAIMNVSSTAAERESPDRGLRSGEGRDRRIGSGQRRRPPAARDSMFPPPPPVSNVCQEVFLGSPKTPSAMTVRFGLSRRCVRSF